MGRRSIEATWRPWRHSARKPLRAVTVQPSPASLRVTEMAMTGSPVAASSRMTLARKRPSFSSTPMMAREGPPRVNRRRLAAK